ncbi:hypothetical protein [Paraherbaspirillum soli]|uniref:Uncharacterized protein n=1 Tax=Paraherbaspirillum soli TaxID=631222 RepID=A0ABW0M8I9_9BURK
MKEIVFAFLIALLLAVVSPLTHAEEDEYYNAHTIRASDYPKNPPGFEQFPAIGRFNGRVMAPDVRSHPRSRLFRTMIGIGAKQAPNFAGHYTIVRWGCGSGCVSLAIVDANTGKVFHPASLHEVDNENVDYDELIKPDGALIKYRLDSRLLIVVGGINENSALRGISYFEWRNNTLRRIRFVHRPFE